MTLEGFISQYAECAINNIPAEIAPVLLDQLQISHLGRIHAETVRDITRDGYSKPFGFRFYMGEFVNMRRGGKYIKIDFPYLKAICDWTELSDGRELNIEITQALLSELC